MGRTSPGTLRPGELRQPCAVCPDSEASQIRVAQRAQVAAGILNIDKPQGLTSHDVVDRVRRASRLRRVGHAGTLDPLATGVLLVLLGPATRLAEYVLRGRKVYRAQVHLGMATETGDAEGRVLSQASIDHMTRADIERALESFRGRIEQVPPAYAAIKMDGTPLYRLARRGAAVQVGPRQVDIYRLELLRWEPPRAELEVECSAGTYIRALARDLGEALGCGAHLSGLVRLRSGRFALENALSLEEVERHFARGTWADILHPMDEALLDYPAWGADEEAERRLRQGQPVAGPDPGQVEAGKTLARAYNRAGEFFAVLSYNSAAKVWKPRKVLQGDENLS